MLLMSTLKRFLAFAILFFSLLGFLESPMNAVAACTNVSLTLEDRSTLPIRLCVPSAGSPRYAGIVDLRARSCEGPEGIPPGWEETALPSWGFVVLVIDSLAARGLAPRKCADWNALTPRQVIGDAYAGLDYLVQEGRIDAGRVALLGFRAGIGTAALLADSTEALDTFSQKGTPGFRAVFAISPYCNLAFSGTPPRFYAPVRIFTGEKDDFEPAERCTQLANSLRASGTDMDVTVYSGVGAGFDLMPPDADFPVRDDTALHPSGTTISTHPQYSPWAVNLADCTLTFKNVFEWVDSPSPAGCTRRGIHFQGSPDWAAQLHADLRQQLDELTAAQTLGSRRSGLPSNR
jgi:dienelactone hydrolase